MGHDRAMAHAPVPASPVVHRMTRSSSDRVVAGVCAGVGHHLGLSVRVVRIVWVALLVAGPGLPMYLLLWVFVPVDTEGGPARPVEGTSPWSGSGSGPTGGAPAGRPVPISRSGVFIALGVTLLVLGLSSLGPMSGLDFGWGIPVVAIVAGAVVAWSQLDEAEMEPMGQLGPLRRALLVARPALGLALVVAGVVAVSAEGGSPGEALRTAGYALVVLIGAAVIASPWVVRLWRRLQREQAETARATERAEVAAHLHDSVLQTLALIQRTSDDPAAVHRLARAQERELRGWLYGASSAQTPGSLSTAVAAVVAEVEDRHGIPVELVTIGDRPLDEPVEALLSALREGLLNAVRHGETPVAVYVEVSPGGVEAFVRDHGPGFDLADVPADRLGVRESIIGRMTRHGGRASVRRLDDGMEVVLALSGPAPEAAG